MTPDDVSRVLVVDDDPQLQVALRSVLSRADLKVAAVGDRTQALEVITTAAPDLLVLDLTLPDGDGLDLLADLRSWSDIPVLVLTGATDPRRMLAAFDAGADDFLRKPFGPEELLARVRALLRRPRADEPEMSVRVFDGLEIDVVDRVVRVADRAVHLTPTEWRILLALVSHPGKLLTHRWLLGEVWDGAHGDETRAALRTHVRTLRGKIGDDANAPRYIATESGAGYRWIAAAEQESSESSERSGLLVASGEAERAPGGDPALGSVVHDLNNALTAARLAVALVRSRGAAVEQGTAPVEPGALTGLLDDVTGMLQRVGRLVTEVERLADPDREVADAED